MTVSIPDLCPFSYFQCGVQENTFTKRILIIYSNCCVVEGYPYDVIVTRRENEGFGFVIISSVTKAGSTIGEFIGMCHPVLFLLFLS